MKRDRILRELEDDQSLWMAFYSELWLHQHEVGGRSPYLPSPSEIEQRCEQIRWLEWQGFCRAFIVNVMEHENPTMERVVQMVKRYGPVETYRRCREFMLPTEYDQEESLGSNRHGNNFRRVSEAEDQGRGT
jgi:hypothetical protein